MSAAKRWAERLRKDSADLLHGRVCMTLDHYEMRQIAALLELAEEARDALANGCEVRKVRGVGCAEFCGGNVRHYCMSCAILARWPG